MQDAGSAIRDSGFDAVFAARLLRRSPGFTAAAVLTLALGVGVNTAVFSVVNATVLRPLPVHDPARLVALATERDGGVRGRLSYRDIADHHTAGFEVFEEIAGYDTGFAGLAVEGSRAARVLTTWVTGNYFEMLGIQPALGRFITRGEVDRGRTSAIVVLGHSAWRRRFAADPSVVGRTVRVNGRPCVVVGVAPSGFRGTFAFSDSEIYLPVNWSGYDNFDYRTARHLHAIGRLRPGVSLERARVVVTATATRLSREHRDTNAGLAIRVMPERFARPDESMSRSTAPGAAMMVALAGLVLAVAALNVTNLLLARAVTRRRELAVRAALGASQWRLLRQSLVESLMLAGLGGAAGLLLGTWAGQALEAVRLPGDLPVSFDFHFDARVFGYALAVVILSGIVAGVVPALRTSRSKVDRVLRDSRQDPGSGRRHLRFALVALQVGACVVVLAAAGMFIRSLLAAERMDPGFSPQGVLNAHMDVEQLGYTRSQGRAFYDQLESRLRALPAVEHVSYAFRIPMDYIRVVQHVEAYGRPGEPAQRIESGVNFVSHDYFETMGIPIVRGRGFRRTEDATRDDVAIVNDRLAAMLWPGEDPLGRRFSRYGPGGPWFEVVGVTPTGKYHQLFEDPQPHFYLSLDQHHMGLRVLQVRTAGSPEALAPVIERIVHELEPNLPVYDVQTMTRALGGGYGLFLVRVAAFSSLLFGLLGLALASVGIYGVVAHVARQRTREIGIRIALGAAPRDILRLVVGDGSKPVIVGIGAGVAVALASLGGIEHFLFGVSSRDPLTFAIIAPLVGVIAVLACLLPARRAARTEPAITLRAE